MKLLVGVDIGTTRLKVGVFDVGGRMVSLAQRDCAPTYLRDGRVATEPEKWWRSFCECFGQCLEEVEGGDICAIAVSSQAQTYVLLDHEGNPLGPAVSWLDMRGDARGTSEELSGLDYYGHTGWACPGPVLAACKLRRLGGGKEGWASGTHLLFADGYLLYRLTGGFAVSRNLAAMSGLYSMKEDDWWPKALAAARVPREALPTIHEVGEAVGALDGSLAREWGVAEVPVVAGANDQTAAALGVGLCEAGEATLALGTALVLYQVILASALPANALPVRGPYPGGLHYQLMLCDTGCAVLEWARSVWSPGCPWEELFREALAVSPGCNGVRADPDFGSGGGFSGLRLGHDRAHLFRALLEGLACAARFFMDALVVRDRLVVTGGGAENDGWMQMTADITGRELERLSDCRATLRGTALLAGRGAGILGEAACLGPRCGEGNTVFTPRKAYAKAYDEVYSDYLAMRERGGKARS